MNHWFLQSLRCPVCKADLQKSFELELHQHDLHYGLISCTACHGEFPVVEGVPILLPADSRTNVYSETLEKVIIKGALISEIIEAIRAKDKVTAFGLLLNPLNLTAPSWTLSLPPPHELPKARVASAAATAPSSSGTASIKQRLLTPLRLVYRHCRMRYRKFMLPKWRLELARYLQRYADRLSARNVIDIYFGEYCGHTEIGPYFQCRFGQPRHLAALSVVQLMRSTPGPLLDMACGAGHLTHFLSYGRDAGPVVGVDRDFFRLFLAKKYISPQAQFACIATEPVLPFANGLFEAILCSDAFHVIPSKAELLAEFRRTMSARGSIFLARVGNSELEPNEGYEVDVKSYAGLFADMPCAMVAEEELKSRYLTGMGPDLSRGTGDTALRHAKWLTLVATHRDDLLIEHGSFDDWPHAVGHLDINPLYVGGETQTNGDRYFELCFPTPWYEFENSGYTEYASASFSISEEDRSQLNSQRESASVKRRIDRYEVLGLPDYYLHPRI